MLDREILVVDDEKDLRTMIRSIFESAGYTQVTTVASGEDALALMAKKIPGIIILDVMMPDMDGFELLREIRQTSEIPVLMLTAKGEAEDRCRGLELGADDYLVKPLSPQRTSSAGQRDFETGISRQQSDGHSCRLHRGSGPGGGPP